VTDASNGETLPYSSVVLHGDGPAIGTLSNVDGYYAIQGVPPDRPLLLTISYVGYFSFQDSVVFAVNETRRVDIQLTPEPIETQEIIVEAERDEEERLIQPGFIAIETAQIREMPAIGEADILRSLQLLPGIQSASDISSGLYVRGGGPDQTLILLDQIPLYNPSHAFGFFSTFNPDAIKDVSLHKGAYPAQYGGRLGAVLDVRNKDGNRKGFEGSGGVSLIASRLTLEGPTRKGSWIVSGRRTYVDPLLSILRTDSTDVPSYYFYDLNAKINQDISEDNKLQVSGYFGRDDLTFDVDPDTFFKIRWGNSAFTGKWTHVFSPTVFGNFMIAGSKYTSTSTLNIFDTPILFKNSIQDATVKGDLDWFAAVDHALSGGFLFTRYDFEFLQTFNNEEQLALREKPNLLSAYLQDHWQPGTRWDIRLGARGNYFSDGERWQIEPRLSTSYRARDNWRLKAAGGIYHQYLQLVTTEAFAGSDFWVPLDGTVEPGRSWQGVAGIEWEPSLRYQVSLEGYYTGLANLVLLDTRVAADRGATTSEEVFVTGGTGHSTGLELFLQRRTGRLTGWIGYTLGWTRRQFSELNGGREFAPKYDRRHDVSFVSSYRLGKWAFGANYVYGTGQSFTPASGRYTLRSPAIPDLQIEDLVLPADKNSARLLPYHRMDLSVKRKFGLFGAKAEGFLQVFNAYNRRNEWFIQYDVDNPETDPKVVKMLPIVPTIGINFEF
ncbi:MAG: TonB-dependent receptor plug domain-containing protein, partial [bacterium]|nr:TonB-dependent receptor plug domain-containing protein [bacterium]